MPLYEYQCDACGHRFEVIQKFSDAPIDTCPRCAGAVHKLLSTPAIQFKGSGWYITDYARAGKTDSNAGTAATSDSNGGGDKSSEGKKESTDASKTDKKSETKSDTKSESKPAAPPTTS